MNKRYPTIPPIISLIKYTIEKLTDISFKITAHNVVMGLTCAPDILPNNCEIIIIYQNV